MVQGNEFDFLHSSHFWYILCPLTPCRQGVLYFIVSPAHLQGSEKKQNPDKRQNHPLQWPKPGWRHRWRWTWKADQFPRGAMRIPMRPTGGSKNNCLKKLLNWYCFSCSGHVFILSGYLSTGTRHKKSLYFIKVLYVFKTQIPNTDHIKNNGFHLD